MDKATDTADWHHPFIVHTRTLDPIVVFLNFNKVAIDSRNPGNVSIGGCIAGIGIPPSNTSKGRYFIDNIAPTFSIPSPFIGITIVSDVLEAIGF